MSVKSIHITPLERLEETLANVRAGVGQGGVYVCGLLGPDMQHPALPVAEERRLRLNFHDVAHAREGFTPPEVEHIRALLAFAKRWRAAEDAPALVLHCWMGISRSPAAAYIVQCALNPQVNELALAQELRRLAPLVTPNPRLVALADELLGKGGRMVAAARAIGRGEEAFIGQPVTWVLASTGLAAQGSEET